MKHSPFSRALAVALPLVLTAQVFGQWSQAQLSTPRGDCAATTVGDLALFAGGGGASVDLYHEPTGTWTVANLSVARSNMGAASSGGRAYFGGGLDATGTPSDVVDVFDGATGVWTTLQLPTVRGETVATAVVGLVLFCDGLHVDILDTATASWSSATLSVGRSGIAATSVGTLALFAGGERAFWWQPMDIVDIFDATTGTWSTAALSVRRSHIAATSVGGRAIFAGGQNINSAHVVDIFDAATGTWSVAALSIPRHLMGAASVGGFAYFAGGLARDVFGEDPVSFVDIFHVDTGTWSTANLSLPRGSLGATAVGSRVLFAGGVEDGGFIYNPVDRVDIYDDAIGSTYCGPSVPNSTGRSASLAVLGYPGVVSQGFVHLAADSLPVGTFGYFLTSRVPASVAGPGGSQGTLCLGGAIGRFVGPGQIQQADAAGHIALSVDLTAVPQPNGAVVALSGDTWSFQAWYRDVNPGPTSNFTDAVSVQFQPISVPTMVPIPAGTFLMGSNASNSAPYHNSPAQQPVHQVTISYQFWMGQHEVTQAEYQALMGVNPSYFPGATRPVEQVTWFQARAYCAALTVQQAGSIPAGYEYRLPTEAEWEYACRAGTTTEFHYGPDLFCNQARFGTSYHSNPPASCGNPSGTAPVGSYAPNAFGLYDMHGNAWEWCLDSWAPYTSAAVTDPFVTGGPSRVLRGGSWADGSSFCRSAVRYDYVPGITYYDFGFRVVLAPVLVP